MANAVQKYVNNKLCCVSTSTHATHELLKHSVENAMCCINNDFIANVFLEMLACNPSGSDATWWTATVTHEFFHVVPGVPVFPTTVTVTANPIVTSYDGAMTIEIPMMGDYVCTDLIDLNTQLHTVINQAFNSAQDFTSSVVIDPLTGIGTYTLKFSEEWGTATDPWSATALGLVMIDFNSTSISSSITETDNISGSCMTNEELCEMKTWLDKYCQKCTGGYEPQEVTSPLV